MPQQTGRKDVLLITLLGTAHGLSHFFHLVIPPLFPWLMEEFSTSYAQMGAVMTLFFIVSSLGQATSGVLVDKFGPKICLYAGVSLLMISGFLLCMAPGYLWLFPVAACAGLGNSVFHPTDYSLMNRAVSSERLAYAFSIHSVLGNVGWALAPVMMVAVASITGSWRMAAGCSGVLALIMLAVLLAYNGFFDEALGREKEEAPQTKTAEVSDAGFGFLKVLAVWLCFFFFFFNSFAFGILQNYAPSIFKAEYGIGLELSTSSLTAYIIGSTIGILSGAFVAKAFRKSENVIACSMVVSAAMAVLLALGWFGARSVLPLMFLMGLGVGIATPSRDLLIRSTCMSSLGKNSYGRVYGFTYCGMDVGQTLAPLVAGPLLDAGYFSTSLVLVAVFMVFAVGTALGVGTQNIVAKVLQA